MKILNQGTIFGKENRGKFNANNCKKWGDVCEFQLNNYSFSKF